MTRAPDLHDTLAAAGCEIDHHESDLYVRADDTARAIIAEHAKAAGRSFRPSLFKSERDGLLWFDVPFAYSPWWRERAMTP